MSVGTLTVTEERVVDVQPVEARPVVGSPVCPARVLLMRLADKWTTLVIRVLAQRSTPVRFNELRRIVGGISQKMLSQTLRDMERDGLVSRTVFAEIPPRVEYAITPLGATLETPLGALHAWAERHMHEVDRARELYRIANP